MLAAAAMVLTMAAVALVVVVQTMASTLAQVAMAVQVFV
jgi:hypothetical protein